MKRLLSIALSVLLIVSVNAFPLSARAEGSKLIVHWSSVDGVDVMEPLIFEAASEDKTVGEILEDEGKQYSDKFFIKEGYIDLGFRMPEPITEYNDYSQLIITSAELKHSIIGKNNLDIYCMMFKNTESASVEIANPVCGISTSTEKIFDEECDKGYYYGLSTQTNYPRATIPRDVNYHLVSVQEGDLNGAYWAAESAINSEPFIGTFEGEKQYTAIVVLVSNFGYLLDNENGEFFINGVPIKDSLGKRGAYYGMISLTAEHISDTGTVTKKASYTEKGIITYRCKGCGAVLKNKELPILEKLNNTVVVKGKTVRIKANKIGKKKTIIKRKKVIKVTNAKGKISYKKIKGNSKIKVSKRGNIIVKQGIKRGTYNIKVKVKAAGNNKYKAKSKLVSVKIIIE